MQNIFREHFNEIVAVGKKIFKEVKVFKPKSSRKESKESFIICKNLKIETFILKESYIKDYGSYKRSTYL